MSQLHPRAGRSRRLAALAAACALLAAATTAQAAPSHMTVQGYLADTSGAAVSGDYTLLLSLYDTHTAPTAFWTESHTVAVVDGIFDALIGADVGNPLTVADFADNDEVWLGVTVMDGPGVPDGGEAELPRRQLSATGYAFAAGYAQVAGAAEHATTADSATSATSAATATTAAGLSCSGCVSVAMLGFDPATQVELQAALAALQIPASVHGLSGGTITSAVTVDGELTATSFSLPNGTAVCDASGNCGATLESLACAAPDAVPVYDHVQQGWTCGPVTAAELACSGCVDPSELSFDPATQAELDAALGDYVASADLLTLLATYVKSSDLTTILGGYVNTDALAAALTDYATTGELANYVSNSGLALVLADYITSAGLTAMLTAYAKTSDLASYAKLTDLDAYAKLTDLPTSVHGLAGGTITTSVAVNGEVAADVLRQNGSVVCDESGNCGTTLGGFDPAAGCTADQVLRWTGAGWACADANAGSVPAQPCTGAGKALQWDGSAWQCVDVRDLGLSHGEANGYEVIDDWGDAWDGIARGARSWDEANQACLDDGGRLPTVTEVWRNRASYGTGNIATSNPTDARYHWTVAPSYRANYYTAVYFSNNSVTEYASTSSLPFRCIWKRQQPTGFTGNRCFGPPGAECEAKDSFFNIDRWSRAPQYLPAARRECELEHAAVATAEDLESLIEGGTDIHRAADVSWPFWHWTTSGGYHGNSHDYQRIIRWTKEAEPWWSATSGVANHAGPSSLYMFRCVGKKSPTSGVQPSDPPCHDGACFEIAGAARDRLIADAADRPAASWAEAFDDCLADGAALPSTEELYQLITAGWAPDEADPGRYIWTSSPATWGWQTYTWRTPSSTLWNNHYEYSPSGNYYTSNYATPTTALPYRCVWRETEVQDFVTCAADEVQMRDEATGAYSCVTAAVGDANGQQNPSNLPPFVDAWGNAFDLFERGAATYPDAAATCASLGGRLPVATELYRVRYQQGVATTELGQPGTATQNYIWTMNPDYRENYRIQLRLSDGGARSIASNGASTAPFRCVWPATRPEAFSGHACYGEPSDPCMETGRLRTDRFPRAIVPQASAQWECRYFGGRLMSLAEYAQLQHAGLPNSEPNHYEWTREWVYWSNGNTYIFTPARGNNPSQAGWQFDSGKSEHNWDTYGAYRPFRCVFTDVMQ